MTHRRGGVKNNHKTQNKYNINTAYKAIKYAEGLISAEDYAETKGRRDPRVIPETQAPKVRKGSKVRLAPTLR